MRYVHRRYEDEEYRIDDCDLSEMYHSRDRLEEEKLQSLRDGGDEFALGEETVDLSLYSSELPSRRFYRRRN